jgi:hypothetical protein|tara:strand:+ start:326 stop:541 length:216 start_codon:yes stop_codon:yes gene_type:complete
MVTLKEIKDNMSSKIIIPKEFDDCYEWTINQIEKHGEYFISGVGQIDFFKRNSSHNDCTFYRRIILSKLFT